MHLDLLHFLSILWQQKTRSFHSHGANYYCNIHTNSSLSLSLSLSLFISSAWFLHIHLFILAFTCFPGLCLCVNHCVFKSLLCTILTFMSHGVLILAPLSLSLSLSLSFSAYYCSDLVNLTWVLISVINDTLLGFHVWWLFSRGGLSASDEESFRLSHFQPKKLENWEDQILNQSQRALPVNVDVIKQEISQNSNLYGLEDHEEFQALPRPAAWSQQIMPVSSPRSCVTSLSNNNILDFSYKKMDGSNQNLDHSSEVFFFQFSFMQKLLFSSTKTTYFLNMWFLFWLPFTRVLAQPLVGHIRKLGFSPLQLLANHL